MTNQVRGCEVILCHRFAPRVQDPLHQKCGRAEARPQATAAERLDWIADFALGGVPIGADQGLGAYGNRVGISVPLRLLAGGIPLRC